MTVIRNNRPGVLVLPKGKLVLKKGAQVEIPALTEELQNAVARGWVKAISPEDSKQGDKAAAHDDPAKSQPHDWEIDYSRADEGVVTVSDRVTGKEVEGEIVERKGERYFTLRDLGTVKGQQYWPTAQALERFDDAS